MSKHYGEQTVVRPVSPLLKTYPIVTITHRPEDTKTNTITHATNQTMWEPKYIGCRAQPSQSVSSDTLSSWPILAPDSLIRALSSTVPSLANRQVRRAQGLHQRNSDNAALTLTTQLNTWFHHALHWYWCLFRQYIKMNWLKTVLFSALRNTLMGDHCYSLSMPWILFLQKRSTASWS